MRRSKGQNISDLDDLDSCQGYRTYRPLSNLPTPPPSSRNSSAAQSPRTTLDDGEPLMPRYRGPAIHLVNLIPSSTSLATASVPLVQALLSRADLPIETVALAVCILDSLDSRFARRWRISCPLTTTSPSSKRHTLPPNSFQHMHHTPHTQHIDSVSPELIILTALVIAVKFTEDPQEHSQYYCQVWGRGMWSHQQLNVTERCIMENLDYRIMPLCNDECLVDAMVDMQLAAQPTWEQRFTPPESASSDDDYVPTHTRSKTLGTAVLGLGLSLTPVDTPDAVVQATVPRSNDYFGSHA